MHVHQFWWVWPLWFQKILLTFCLPSKRPNLPFRPWTIYIVHGLIVHGGQIIELAQKNYVSRGDCKMHGKHFWWARLF